MVCTQSSKFITIKYPIRKETFESESYDVCLFVTGSFFRLFHSQGMRRNLCRLNMAPSWFKTASRMVLITWTLLKCLTKIYRK